jgi:hypothetical protein
MTMDLPRDMILEIIKHLHDNEHENIGAAKNFREANKFISELYTPFYIYKHIGGSFGKAQHKDVIVINTRLWYSELNYIHNVCETENTIKNFNYFLFLICGPRRINSLFDLLRKEPNLIFDNDKMELLISKRIEASYLRMDYCINKLCRI